MTGYLVKIAARTDDKRFDKLREDCYLPPAVHYHNIDDPQLSCSSWLEGYSADACPGYTVIEDLGVLLECAAKIKRYGVSYSEVFDKAIDGMLPLGKPNVDPPDAAALLEAAAKAVYEWLGTQEKETSELHRL